MKLYSLLALGLLSKIIPLLWQYFKYLWNEVTFSSTVVTFDKLYAAISDLLYLEWAPPDGSIYTHTLIQHFRVSATFRTTSSMQNTTDWQNSRISNCSWNSLVVKCLCSSQILHHLHSIKFWDNEVHSQTLVLLSHVRNWILFGTIE